MLSKFVSFTDKCKKRFPNASFLASSNRFNFSLDRSFSLHLDIAMNTCANESNIWHCGKS